MGGYMYIGPGVLLLLLSEGKSFAMFTYDILV